jgi:hypothetical protein
MAIAPMPSSSMVQLPAFPALIPTRGLLEPSHIFRSWPCCRESLPGNGGVAVEAASVSPASGELQRPSKPDVRRSRRLQRPQRRTDQQLNRALFCGAARLIARMGGKLRSNRREYLGRRALHRLQCRRETRLAAAGWHATSPQVAPRTVISFTQAATRHPQLCRFRGGTVLLKAA